MPLKRDTASIYPCHFPIKVIGEHCAGFEEEVLSFLGGNADILEDVSIGRKVSGGGKYLSLTVHIIARDREHLEMLYSGLKARPKVIMVL